MDGKARGFAVRLGEQALEGWPLAAGPRPQTRTTDDYLKEREEIEKARAKVKAERARNDGDGSDT